MNPINILKRALHITWSYRALWVFGIILALATASGSNNPGGSGGSHDSGGSHSSSLVVPQTPEEFLKIPDEFQKVFSTQPDLSQGEITTLIWIGIVALVVVLLLVLVMTVARFVAETALMRMVDGYETTGEKVGVRRGFRLGWSRSSFRLFLINLLVNLPVILLVFILGLVGVAVYFAFTTGNEMVSTTTTIIGIGIFFISIFLAFLYSVIVMLLQEFFWRTCVLKGVGVIEAIRQGFGLVKRNWKKAGLMWLVMFGLGIAWSLALVIIVIVLIPVFVLTAMLGLVVGGIPALVVGYICSLFFSGEIAIITGAVVGVPLFIFIMATPIIFLQGLKQVFKSSVWTLVYREITALESLSPEAN